MWQKLLWEVGYGSLNPWVQHLGHGGKRIAEITSTAWIGLHRGLKESLYEWRFIWKKKKGSNFCNVFSPYFIHLFIFWIAHYHLAKGALSPPYPVTKFPWPHSWFFLLAFESFFSFFFFSLSSSAFPLIAEVAHSDFWILPATCC